MRLFFHSPVANATRILLFLAISGLHRFELEGVEPNPLFPIVEKGVCAYFDGNGREVFRLTCEQGGDFREGLAPVQVPGGRWGYADRAGTLTIKAEFDDADAFSEGLARVRQNGLYGYIDRDGRIVLPFKYSRSGRLSGGLIWFQCESGIFNSGYMDRKGKQILPCKYQEAADFGPDGLARARMWDLYGFIDSRGTAVLNFAYRLAGRFDGGLAPVLRDDGYYYIDRTGKRLLRVQPYDLPADYSEGLAAVRSSANMRWGYMDRTGKLVIPFLFFEARQFQNGLALVRGLKGYSIPSEAGEDSPDENDLRWFYINREGRRLFPR